MRIEDVERYLVQARLRPFRSAALVVITLFAIAGLAWLTSFAAESGKTAFPFRSVKPLNEAQTAELLKSESERLDVAYDPIEIDQILIGTNKDKNLVDLTINNISSDRILINKLNVYADSPNHRTRCAHSGPEMELLTSISVIEAGSDNRGAGRAIFQDRPGYTYPVTVNFGSGCSSPYVGFDVPVRLELPPKQYTIARISIPKSMKTSGASDRMSLYGLKSDILSYDRLKVSAETSGKHYSSREIFLNQNAKEAMIRDGLGRN